MSSAEADPSDSPLVLDRRPRPIERAVALFEVLLCCGIPTQIALTTTFAVFGYGPEVGGRMSLGYVTALSLLDAAMLISLIVFFLRAHGERPYDVFIGRRSIAAETARGVGLIFVAFAIVITVLLVIQRFAPSLHTVRRNPLEDLISSPARAALFALVVVVAGGIREELSRGFQLHRFDRFLGGGAVGVVFSSVVFGAGHYQVQGADAAIATGILGAFWGVVYLRRRSSVAPVVSHAGFDLLEIVQAVLVAR